MVYISPNQYHLPMNCYIFFLPPDAFLFLWELNYLVLTVTATLAALLVVFYIPLPLLLMNHSCWHIDMALIAVANINENLHFNENNLDLVQKRTIKNSWKTFFKRCEKFVEWHNEVQDLLFWYFNLEFQIQSLILCWSIYVLCSSFAGVLILLMFLFCATQIFILCWMGTRVASRVDQLSFEISKNWYLIQPKQRKELQMILHWSQNMKGFSSLFKDVSLETCRTVGSCYSGKMIFEAFFLRFLKLHSPSTLFCAQRTTNNLKL